MSRYIDADEKLTITVYDDEHEENIDHYMTIGEILDTYTSEGCPPTADVVEVVRCKDCKHFHDGIYNGEYWMECDEYRIALSSDEWFCADEERRTDG